MSYAGIVGGGVAGTLLLPGGWSTGNVKGACLGVGLAVFAQMLMKPIVTNKEN